MNSQEQAVVLVVDDTKANIDLLTAVLQPDYKIETANSGEDALQIVDKLVPLDLILLDVKMGGMDGYEACRQLKQNQRYKDIPIIFISALAEPEEKVKGFSVGGVDYLTKPMYPEEVLARVNLHVQNAQMQRQLKNTHDLLERRVIERTQELEEANKTLRYMYKRVAHSEKQYRDLLEASPDGVLLVNEAGDIEMANSSAANLYGYSIDEMCGMSVEKLVPKRFSSHHLYRKKYMEAPAHMALGKPRSGRPGPQQALWGVRKDGSEFPVDITLSPMTTVQGKIVVADVRDLSDRIMLEEQLNQAQKMEALGQLTGGIAHDFNNILAIIIAYTELMQGVVAQDEKLAKYLAEILKAGDRARNLIAQMLLFSRIDPKRELSPLDLGLVVKDAIKLLRPVLPSSIELRWVIADALEPVNVDPVQVNQLILNLCINSRDAMNETGLIEINVVMAQLDSQVCSSCHQHIVGKFIEVSVIDTGPGIIAAVQKRIFEPFFTTKEVGKGTGMGLSMVHGIMHHFGGHIMVDSKLNTGVKFTLLFPVAEPQHAEMETTDDDIEIDFNGNGETILVVDDEEVISLFIYELLKGKGYHVVSFDDSLSALEYFEKHSQEVDLVITDQTMPELTGLKMAQAMRESRNDLPIILATGYSAIVDEEKSKVSGIAAFLHKPFETQKLLVTIKRLLTG